MSLFIHITFLHKISAINLTSNIVHLSFIITHITVINLILNLITIVSIIPLSLKPLILLLIYIHILPQIPYRLWPSFYLILDKFINFLLQYRITYLLTLLTVLIILIFNIFLCKKFNKFKLLYTDVICIYLVFRI